jgi:hypothetical protein
MAITAKSIIKHAQTTLQDLTGRRWPASELVTYLNMGQRDIRDVRPDTTAVNTTMNLVAGHKQTCPDNVASLIDIPANAGTSKERITLVSGGLLDAQSPNWRSDAKAPKIKHFMHDVRVPTVFSVFPPAAAGVSVEMDASLYPQEVPEPTAPGLTFDTVTGNIGLPDFCESPLRALVLHYAYSKDAEYGGNLNLAQFYLGVASSVLGAEIKTKAEIKREA